MITLHLCNNKAILFLPLYTHAVTFASLITDPPIKPNQLLFFRFYSSELNYARKCGASLGKMHHAKTNDAEWKEREGGCC